MQELTNLVSRIQGNLAKQGIAMPPVTVPSVTVPSVTHTTQQQTLPLAGQTEQLKPEQAATPPATPTATPVPLSDSVEALQKHPRYNEAIFWFTAVKDQIKGGFPNIAVEQITDEGICSELAAKAFVSAVQSMPEDDIRDQLAKYGELIKQLESALEHNATKTNIRELAIRAGNRDEFVKQTCNTWKWKRDEARTSYGQTRTDMIAAGTWPKALKDKAPGLDGQVADLRTQNTQKGMDAQKGKGEGNLKQDLAADKHAGYVQVAQRIARTLGANGPITIDDVTEEMSKRYNVTPEKGKRQHQWKGKTFPTSEWQQVGAEPSRQISAHGRPVARWALKSWIKDNSLNGESSASQVASFVMSRILREYKRIYPRIDLETCNWYVGDVKLSDKVRQTIIAEGNRLYSIPVTFVPGTVGALLQGPNHEATLMMHKSS